MTLNDFFSARRNRKMFFQSIWIYTETKWVPGSRVRFKICPIMEPAVRNYFLSPISLLKKSIVNKKTDLLGSIFLFTIGSPDGDIIRHLVGITPIS